MIQNWQVWLTSHAQRPDPSQARAFCIPTPNAPAPEVKTKMKHPAAALLAADFGRLQHTNERGETGMLHMPGFMTAGMSDEQAAETLGPLATGLAEAIIETLQDRHGYLVVQRDQLDVTAQGIAATQTEAMAANGVPIHCNRCRQPVIQRLRMTDPSYIKIHVPTVLAALQAHAETCL